MAVLVARLREKERSGELARLQQGLQLAQFGGLGLHRFTSV